MHIAMFHFKNSKLRYIHVCVCFVSVYIKYCNVYIIVLYINVYLFFIVIRPPIILSLVKIFISNYNQNNYIT